MGEMCTTLSKFCKGLPVQSEYIKWNLVAVELETQWEGNEKNVEKICLERRGWLD